MSHRGPEHSRGTLERLSRDWRRESVKARSISSQSRRNDRGWKRKREQGVVRWIRSSEPTRCTHICRFERGQSFHHRSTGQSRCSSWVEIRWDGAMPHSHNSASGGSGADCDCDHGIEIV